MFSQANTSISTELKRVVVIGTSGCGKTTFARRLATQLGSPCIELDELHWGSNWTPKPREEFLQLANDAADSERWVIEGNYATVREVIWPRATTIVWLNYRFPTIFSRTLRRTVRRALTRETLWHGNRESLRMSFFSRESILLWVLQTYGIRRKEFSELRTSGKYPNVEWVEFKKPHETEKFIAAERPAIPAGC